LTSNYSFNPLEEMKLHRKAALGILLTGFGLVIKYAGNLVSPYYYDSGFLSLIGRFYGLGVIVVFICIFLEFVGLYRIKDRLGDLLDFVILIEVILTFLVLFLLLMSQAVPISLQHWFLLLLTIGYISVLLISVFGFLPLSLFFNDFGIIRWLWNNLTWCWPRLKPSLK